MSQVLSQAIKGLPEMMYGTPDRQPYEKTDDLLRFFHERAEDIREIPILRRIASGQADIRTWTTYIVHRLPDANSHGKAGEGMTQFERYLSVLATAAEQQGLHSAAAALQENLHEEIGMIGGEIHPKESHAQWRNDFRSKMYSVLRAHGVSESDLAERPSTEDSRVYHHMLDLDMSLVQNGHHLWESLGAITMLERCLEEEFKAVGQGLRHSFPELTTDDAKYIHHHAGHEEKHFADLFGGVLSSAAAQDLYHRIHATIGIVSGAGQIARMKKHVLESYDE
jgi:hypothetical protein